MSVRHEPNHAARQQMLRSPAIESLAIQAGQVAATYAVGISPVREGVYRNSFVVTGAQVEVGGQMRAGARVVNTSPHGWAVERGRGASHVLSRTAAFMEGG